MICKLKKVLCLLCICMLFTYYYIHFYDVDPIIYVPYNFTVPYLLNWTESDDISCHYWTEGDVLPSAEDASFAPPLDSIFFHETSCRGGLNSRQACAVESAARAHPSRKIYILFSAPITADILTGTLMAELKRCPNVEFARVHINAYVKGTILEELLKKRTHNSSKWRVSHTSDMLRFITLYKFGGLYLDTDVIVAKSLDDLGRNWLARESNYLVNGAVGHIAKDALGQQLVLKILEELSISYKPDYFSHNGPEALSRVLSVFCNNSDVREFSSKTCRGFQVYEADLIYPIHYGDYKDYFNPGVQLDSENVYTYHFWNLLSRDTELKPHSLYDRLAKQHCPMTYDFYGFQFGM